MNITADLRKLQQSKSQTSVSLPELVQTFQNKYEKEQKHVQSLEFHRWRDLSKDSVAQLLIPDDLANVNDFRLGVEARKATDDGNCLCNAATIVLVGNESFSPLL